MSILVKNVFSCYTEYKISLWNRKRWKIFFKMLFACVTKTWFGLFISVFDSFRGYSCRGRSHDKIINGWTWKMNFSFVTISWAYTKRGICGLRLYNSKIHCSNQTGNKRWVVDLKSRKANKRGHRKYCRKVEHISSYKRTIYNQDIADSITVNKKFYIGSDFDSR